MKIYVTMVIVLSLAVSWCFADQVQPQTPPAADSSFHPYKVNRWVSGGIVSAGAGFRLLSGADILHKPNIDSSSELATLNTNVYTSRFDQWALKQDPSKRVGFEKVSDNMALSIYMLPAFLLLDGGVRRDWVDLLMMYLETQTITFSVYNLSPLGPNFQNK